MKSIIFTDLDGTLLNDNSVISDYTHKTLKKFTDQGHILVLSSGRSLKSVIKVKNDLNLNFNNIYLCCANGTQIYDCKQNMVIKEERMNMNDVENIWKLNQTMNIHIQTYSDEELIVCKSDKEARFYCIRCPLPIKVCDNPSSILTKPPCKMLAIDLNDKQRLEILSTYIKNNYSNLTTLFSNSKYLEIYSSKAGKGNSLKWLCDYLSVPLQNSYAFGDEENDISMLEVAGTGVAMKNGNPTLFKYANEITEYSNETDGLAKYIEAKFEL